MAPRRGSPRGGRASPRIGCTARICHPCSLLRISQRRSIQDKSEGVVAPVLEPVVPHAPATGVLWLPRRARIYGAETLVSLNLRFKDLQGPVTRVKKKRRSISHPPSTVNRGRASEVGGGGRASPRSGCIAQIC